MEPETAWDSSDRGDAGPTSRLVAFGDRRCISLLFFAVSGMRLDGDPPLRRRVATDRARLNALYDRLCEVADDAERPMIERERRLLVAAVLDAFPDREERAVVERSDRLGLGGAP